MKDKQNWPYSKVREFPLNIGVFSLHPHAGATFVSVLLAEYLANVLGYKTAVIENSSRCDLLSLQPKSRIYWEEGVFQLHQILYNCYNNGQIENSHLTQGFDCYVRDLGSSYARARERMLTCDLTILLFTMTPWYCDLSTLAEKLKKDYGEGTKLCILGNQIPSNLKKRLYQQLRCEFLDYEPNMFTPSLKAVQLFHHILWRR